MPDFSNLAFPPNQAPPDPDLWDAALFAAGQVVAAALNGIAITTVALRRCGALWVSHFPELDIGANSAIGREIARAGVAAQMLAGVAPADLELIQGERGGIRVALVEPRERIRRAEAAKGLRPYRSVILAIACALTAKMRIEGKELAAHLRSITETAGLAR